MRRFKSMLQAKRFVRVHAVVSNLFNLGRHLLTADRYRKLQGPSESDPAEGQRLHTVNLAIPSNARS